MQINPTPHNTTNYNTTFKATVLNEKEIKNCKTLLETNLYKPQHFFADYNEQSQNLKGNKLFSYLENINKSTKKLSTELCQKFSAKIQEIKSWGSKDDLIYIGS